jgi:hypothetical protein
VSSYTGTSVPPDSEILRYSSMILLVPGSYSRKPHRDTSRVACSHTARHTRHNSLRQQAVTAHHHGSTHSRILQLKERSESTDTEHNMTYGAQPSTRLSRVTRVRLTGTFIPSQSGRSSSVALCASSLTPQLPCQCCGAVTVMTGITNVIAASMHQSGKLRQQCQSAHPHYEYSYH